MTLFEVLSERQREEGWNDEQLATEIGISRSYLVLLRSGKKPLSMNVMRKVIATFPEYSPMVLSFLRESVTNSDLIVSGSDAIETESSHAA